MRGCSDRAGVPPLEMGGWVKPCKEVEPTRGGQGIADDTPATLPTPSNRRNPKAHPPAPAPTG